MQRAQGICGGDTGKSRRLPFFYFLKETNKVNKQKPLINNTKKKILPNIYFPLFFFFQSCPVFPHPPAECL